MRHGIGWALTKRYHQELGCLWCRPDLWPHNKVTQRFCKEVLIGLQAVPSAIRCKNKNTCFLPLNGLLERPEGSWDPAPITAAPGCPLRRKHLLPIASSSSCFSKITSAITLACQASLWSSQTPSLHHPGSWRGFLTRWTHHLCSWSHPHIWTHSFPIPLETRETWQCKRKTPWMRSLELLWLRREGWVPDQHSFRLSLWPKASKNPRVLQKQAKRVVWFECVTNHRRAYLRPSLSFFSRDLPLPPCHTNFPTANKP